LDKILITTSSFGKYDPGVFSDIEKRGFEFILNPFSRKLTETEVTDLIQQHQPVGIIAGVEPLTKQVIELSKGLKVISRCGIGMDSVDLKAAKEKNISVVNTPDAPTISVAELTLGLILSLLRKIHVSDAGIRRNQWVRPTGNLLNNKTVGIIGCGRIGSHLSILLKAFGCKILGYDPFMVKKPGIRVIELDDVLSNSNIVSLHIPYNDENYHFINANRIEKIKKGGILVNAARGGLIDENALYDAIISGHLGGAALDCYEKEPYIGKLKNLENVLLTAHIGSYAKEGRVMMERQAVENLFHEFDKIRSVVNNR